MDGPETKISVGGHRVLLLGTIPGYVPDAKRVEAAIASLAPSVIAVGVPPEDMDALAAIVADPRVADGLEPDDLDARFLGLLDRFGPTHVLPSPDLEVAHKSGILLEAVDMDDGHHTGRYTSLVRMHHLVQRSSARKRLEKKGFEAAGDPYTLACQWDGVLLAVKPFAILESEREETMADGIRALAARHERVLAIVHAARFDGVFRRLQAPSTSDA